MATCRGDHKEENLHILLKAQCYFDKCEVLAPVWPAYDWIHHYRHYHHYPQTGAALCPCLLLIPPSQHNPMSACHPSDSQKRYVGWGPMGVIICHSACYHRLSLWFVIGRCWSRDLNTGLWLANNTYSPGCTRPPRSRSRRSPPRESWPCPRRTPSTPPRLTFR